MSLAGAGAAETVLVGDSAIDLRTAKAAGVRLCLVRYGFGFALAEAELDGSELIADRASDIRAARPDALTARTLRIESSSAVVRFAAR